MALKNWSTTPSSNVSGLTGINWNEGMNAAAVNDSARSTMAQIAEWFAQISGGTIYPASIGGTGNAITLTCSPTVDAYAAGQRFAFKASSTNTAATTLNVDGLGAKAIQIKQAGIGAGHITSGDIVVVVYDGTAFQLQSLHRFAAKAGANSDITSLLGLTSQIPGSSDPVKSVTTTAPPGSPSDGDRYLVPTGASGAWASNEGDIAQYDGTGAAWVFNTPLAGMSLYAQDTDIKWLWDGTVLTPDPSSQSPGTIQTGTTYTPELADFSSMIDFTNAGAVAITLPDHSSVPDLIVNSYVLFRLTGTGSVSINTEGSDAIQCTTGATSNIAIADRYGIVAATIVSIDGSNNRTWAVIGNVA